MNNPNLPQGGGVTISPQLKRQSVVITEDGKEIEVKDVKERAKVIRDNLKRNAV